MHSVIPTPLRLKDDQRGIASFIVAMIMMLVISLIVLGFAQTARHNQREALDRQLSTQAYYAAESGVNDATNTILTDLNQGRVVPSQTQCQNGAYWSPHAQLSGTNIGYTCVLVDATPKDLAFSKVNTDSSTIVPIHATSALSSLTFSWSAQTGAPNAPAVGFSHVYHPAAAAWRTGYGIIRVDLFKAVGPVTSANPLQSAQYTKTLFLTPYGTPGTLYSAPNIDYAPGTPSGYIIGGCSTTNPTSAALVAADCASHNHCATSYCAAVVPFATADSADYYARITSVYRNPDSVVVTGTASGSDAVFVGSQAVIDVTGKAQDVLRRVRVRIGLSPGGGVTDLLNNAVTSNSSICKQYIIRPGDNFASPNNLCQ